MSSNVLKAKINGLSISLGTETNAINSRMRSIPNSCGFKQKNLCLWGPVPLELLKFFCALVSADSSSLVESVRICRETAISSLSGTTVKK